VGVVAFLNIRMVSDGHTETYFLLAAVLAGSYALAWQLSEGFATAVLWASAVAGVVALAVVHGFVIHGVKLLTGFGTARCLMFLNSRRHRPFVQFQKAHTKWIGVVAISFVGMFLVPPLAIRVAKFLLPVNELQDAYNLVGQFVGQEKLEALVLKLMVVTALCQVSLGYLGIAFLRQGQNRKNYLLVIGNGEGTGKCFSKLVLRYMLFAALPYMLQRTIVENVNFYVYGRFAREVERSIRLNSVFPLKKGGNKHIACCSSWVQVYNRCLHRRLQFYRGCFLSRRRIQVVRIAQAPPVSRHASAAANAGCLHLASKHHFGRGAFQNVCLPHQKDRENGA